MEMLESCMQDEEEEHLADHEEKRLEHKPGFGFRVSGSGFRVQG